MKEARDRWAKNMDDHSQYSVAVGVEKLVSFLIPASECIEYTCLAFFGTEDLKESITKKTVEPYVMQIMTGTSEALKEIMTNENASPFTVISQMMIFDQCLQKTNLFVKRNYLYNVIHMANVESVANWKRFTAEILSAFTQFMVESRYCHVLKVVRVLPNLADNLMQAKEFSKQIEGRLNHVLSRNGPVNNQLRQIHQEVNQEIADPPVTIRTSEEMAEGGLGLITVLCRSVRGKIEDIAEKGPKYQQLIRMENYYFLQKTLAPRGLSLLNAFVSDCQEQFKKAKELYCEEAIRYQFAKFMDFVMSTRQTLRDSSIEELHYSINKSVFVKSVSLGKVKKPLKRIHDRVKKHFDGESRLTDFCWEEIITLFVKNMQEVEQWARDGYEGLVISPSAEDIKFEMDQIKRNL